LEPSSSQAQQAPQGPIDANQRQAQDPQPSEHDQDQDQVHGGDSSLMGDQGQAQEDEQAQDEGQGEDQNRGDDQGVSQEYFEEAQARRARKVEEDLQKESHTMESVIGSVRRGVSTRRQLANFSSHHAYISCVEPQKVFEALEDPDWVEAMHEELNNFECNKVWSLVEKPKDCMSLEQSGCSRSSKMEWNCCEEQGSLGVAQGYSQVEGIDYRETFAPMTRLESIRILLAYASHHNFKLQQMDVKSAFLNGHLHELVYVKQPPGFEDPNFPNHVYKLDKALYGLKQVPRAWYVHLRELIVDHGF
jgi:hypothetical protein